MKDDILLPFGLHQSDGRLIHISDAARGKSCDCLCPSCNQPLIAKKGDVRVHHFSHLGGADCQYAVETALHLAAKDMLVEAGYINVPEYVLTLKDTVVHHGEVEIIRTDTKVTNSQTISFDNARLEYRLHDIIPDVLVNVNGHDLIIEIFVNHKVDHKKIKKIRELNIPAIEVNINKSTTVIDKELFKKAVIDSIEDKKWLYHPRQLHSERKHQDKIDAIKRTQKRSGRRRGVYSRNLKSYHEPAHRAVGSREYLDYHVEKAGIAFFNKHGRWPSLEETKAIVDSVNSGINKKYFRR